MGGEDLEGGSWVVTRWVVWGGEAWSGWWRLGVVDVARNKERAGRMGVLVVSRGIDGLVK